MLHTSDSDRGVGLKICHSNCVKNRFFVLNIVETEDLLLDVGRQSKTPSRSDGVVFRISAM